MKQVRGWLERSVPPAATDGPGATAAAEESDALAAFGPEAADASRAARRLTAVPSHPRETAEAPTPRAGRWLVIALGIATIAQLPIVALWVLQTRTSLFAADGVVSIETTPPGVEVWIDGKMLGRTPAQLSLPAGNRLIELRHGADRRSLPVTVAAGSTSQQRVEFVDSATAAASAPSKTGTIQITTEPARAAVSVDGTARGASPVTVADLTAGAHSVSVRFSTGTVERQIRLEPGSTASLVVTMPQVAGAMSGWVKIDVPASLQILEGGRLVGTTAVDRLMLPIGEHTLEFASDELGFKTQRNVTVTAGGTSTVKLELPRAFLSINAQPWANVWVDGERVGETPIGNLSRTIGLHEVIFRHPNLGERRASVLITLKEPARIGVDLRRAN